MKFKQLQRLQYLQITTLGTLAILSLGVFAQADATGSESVLATVNGSPITQTAVNTIQQQLTADDPQTDSRGILEELINLEVLTQAAEELDLDKDPDVSTTLQLQYTQTMANAYLARKSEEISFTEEELRQEYALQTANAERTEYRAAHILLDTAEQAASVLGELKDGKTFADAAAEHSVPGDVSSSAVQSDFGFHIIRLDEKRDAALPDFDSVKTGLTNLAIRRALSEHVEELKAAADIETR